MSDEKGYVDNLHTDTLETDTLETEREGGFEYTIALTGGNPI